MAIKVSVVVPTYNSAAFIERGIRSMLAQSLPASEMEVIFVDDGSTDDTASRLEALSQQHRHMRVIPIPHSGWPGKPRNVGIDAARGEYIQFLDHDDWMAPGALERLYTMGVRNGSDIVIGKVASDFRPVPAEVFRRSRNACTIRDAPLIDSLTPHKMFRTAFLREHGIRFPEGKRRLEDQLFMVRAYFPARVVSILADHVCYFYARRDDSGNAASARLEPAGYYGNLREVLDVVIANTEPGAFRNRLLRRFLRTEMLARLSEPKILGQEEAYRRDLFREIRALAADFMPAEVDERFGAVMRLRARLLREDRLDALIELAERLNAIEVRTRIEAAAWKRGRLQMTLMSQFGIPERGADGALVLHRSGDRYQLDPGITDGLEGEPLDVTAELKTLEARLFLREAASGEEWQVTTRATFDPLERDGTLVPRMRATVSLDLDGLAGEGPLPRGTWLPMIRMSGMGLDRRGRFGEDRAPKVDGMLRPALFGVHPRVAVPYFDDAGRLTLDVDRHAVTVAAAVEGRPIFPAPGSGTRITAVLPIASAPSTRRSDVEVVVGTPGGTKRIRARLEPWGDAVALIADLPRHPALPPGMHPVAAHLDGPSAPELRIGTLSVDSHGHGHLEGAERIGRLKQVASDASRWVTARARRSRIPPPAYRRLPSRVRGALRRLGGR